MELLLIELVLWGGLLFLFWALKDGLGNIESDMESMGYAGNARHLPIGRGCYIRPEKVLEPIGTYRDRPIYRYAVIDGRDYQYDHIRPADDHRLLAEDERCIEPGLVYVPCDAGRNNG